MLVRIDTLQRWRMPVVDDIAVGFTLILDVEDPLTIEWHRCIRHETEHAGPLNDEPT